MAGRGAVAICRRSSARASSTRSALRTAFQAQTLATRPAELPEVNLEHVDVMTDDTGMLQHATFNVPRYDEGYCLDDNARALLLMTLVEDAGTEMTPRSCARWRRAISRSSATRSTRRAGGSATSCRTRATGSKSSGSEDSHGRALWALGTVVGRSRRSRDGRASPASLFHAALPVVSEVHEPSILGE